MPYLNNSFGQTPTTTAANNLNNPNAMTGMPQSSLGYNGVYDPNYLARFNQQTSSNQFLKCRPVSSKEEARAAQIDLDGSLWVFTDVGHGQIFTKQIMPNGTAAFRTYQYIQEPETPVYNSNDFITREEFNKTLQNLLAKLQGGGDINNANNAKNSQSNTTLNF